MSSVLHIIERIVDDRYKHLPLFAVRDAAYSTEWFGVHALDHEDAAQSYCEQTWGTHAEYPDSYDEIVVTDGETERTFQVSVEMEPVFSATEAA